MATARNKLDINTIRNLELAVPHMFTLSDTKGNTFHGVTSIRPSEDSVEDGQVLQVTTYIESRTQQLLKATSLVITHFDQTGNVILALEVNVQLNKVCYPNQTTLTTTELTAGATSLEVQFEMLSNLRLSSVR